MLADLVSAYEARRAADAKPKPGKIGAWNVGSCVRYLWYALHGFQSPPSDPAGARRLEWGIAVEEFEATRLVEANVGFRRARRSTLGAQPADWRDMSAHGLGNVIADGFLDVAGETIVVEIKSAERKAFSRALGGLLPDKYLAQAEVYCRAYDVGRVVFDIVALERVDETHPIGCRHEIVYDRDDAAWARILETAAAARADATPDRPHRLEAGGILPWDCTFCPARVECWGPLRSVTARDRERLAVVS